MSDDIVLVGEKATGSGAAVLKHDTRLTIDKKASNIAIAVRKRQERAQARIEKGLPPEEEEPTLRGHQMEKRFEIFFEALALTGHVQASSKAAGYATPVALYLRRAADPAFRARWDVAMMVFNGVLEDELIRRAMEGELVGQYYQGVLVALEAKKSDRLLELLAKARIPDVYGDKAKIEHTHTGTVGVALLPQKAVTADEWRASADRLGAEQAALGSPEDVIDLTPTSVRVSTPRGPEAHAEKPDAKPDAKKLFPEIKRGS